MPENRSTFIGAAIVAITRPLPLRHFEDGWLAYSVWIHLDNGTTITLVQGDAQVVHPGDQSRESLPWMNAVLGGVIREVLLSDEWPLAGLLLEDGRRIGWDVDVANREVYPAIQ